MNTSLRISVSLALLLFVCLDTCESSEVTVKSNVSYNSVIGLDFVEADAKLVYGDTNPELQYGLLWLPKQSATHENPPLIVLIHGGCWLNAYDIEHSFPLSSALAQAGYAVWSLEYRRTGDAGGGWPGSIEDIRLGLAFTSSLDANDIDLDRMLVMGHSAGGHLALLAAAQSQTTDGVIGLAAITDIVTYSQGENDCQRATTDFMGGTFEELPVAYEAANPSMQPLHDKTILLHGDMDVIVPLEQSQLPGATTVVFEGAGHFDWIHPGSGAFELLLSTLEDFFQE